MLQLAALFCCFAYSTGVAAQISKGSFGLVTTDPVCVECDYATVAWHGGMAPYVLSVSGNKNSYKLTNVGVTSTNQMKWHVNFPTGTQLWFQLIDGNSTDIYTNIVTVAASSDASCVNVTNPLITDSSTTSSSLPSTTYTSVLSSTVAVGASASPDPNSNASSSDNSTGAIAGGIVAGIIVLLLLLLGLWWLRRSKRRGSRQDSKTELDLNAERHGMVIEPFLPISQISETHQPVSTKVRGIPSAGFSATDISSSNPGPSTTASGSSAPQSV
ncbi:hypothetical protein FRC09_010429, partial [Ceratobasidium sp. 395]